MYTPSFICYISIKLFYWSEIQEIQKYMEKEVLGEWGCPKSGNPLILNNLKLIYQGF